MTRPLSALRAICPQCKLRRFIPHFTAPYCTPSCEHAAVALTGAPAVPPGQQPVTGEGS